MDPNLFLNRSDYRGEKFASFKPNKITPSKPDNLIIEEFSLMLQNYSLAERMEILSEIIKDSNRKN
jgi:hypothetical protein